MIIIYVDNIALCRHIVTIHRKHRHCVGLAKLYGIEPSVLIQPVKRNRERKAEQTIQIL